MRICDTMEPHDQTESLWSYAAASIYALWQDNSSESTVLDKPTWVTGDPSKLLEMAKRATKLKCGSCEQAQPKPWVSWAKHPSFIARGETCLVHRKSRTFSVLKSKELVFKWLSGDRCF